MDPHGLKLWLIFLATWVVFWGTAGGLAARWAGRRVGRGILLGGILAIVGVMLTLLVEDEPTDRG